MRFHPVPLALAFLLGACASGRPIEVSSVADASRFAGADTVIVELTNFEFTPSTVRLEAGRPYILRLENDGSGGHDFTAPDFFEAASILASDAALVKEGEVDLEKGASASIHLIPAKGTYDLACTHIGHAALGMTGKIVVE